MWRYLIRPILFLFDPERVHHVTMVVFVAFMKIAPLRWLVRRCTCIDDPRLRTQVAGIDLPNPIGLAAGFDKDARWFNALADLGFGHVEVGTLTGHAQAGNPKPRLFRLTKDQALINRFGFNNQGSVDAAAALRARRVHPILGVNIGKSKVVTNEDAVSDYLASLERVIDVARYITVNVSSPNTAGLRDLQEAASLRALLEAVSSRTTELAAAREIAPPPVFVKIAPDLDDDSLAAIVELAIDAGMAAIIATNTTISRSDLATDAAVVDAIGAGGLSGRPLTERSRAVVAYLYRVAAGRIPIIGVGGVMTPEDAWEMICAGASAVQIYTGFVYGGPLIVAQMNRHIRGQLEARGWEAVADAVGCEAGTSVTAAGAEAATDMGAA